MGGGSLSLIPCSRFGMWAKGGSTLSGQIGELAGAILSHCSGSRGHPADAMRALLQHGLTNGVLPLATRPPIGDIRIVNALLANFNQTGFYDFKFLHTLSGTIEESIKSPMDALEFMSRLTDLGHYSETLTLAAMTGLVREGGLVALSPRDKASLIAILARQRFPLTEVIDPIVISAYHSLDGTSQIELLKNLAYLNLSLPGSLSLPVVPVNTRDSVNMALAFVLSRSMMERSDVVESHLIPTIFNLVKSVSSDPELYMARDPVLRRDVNIIRYALRYCYRASVYDKLDESVKSFFAVACSTESQPLRPGRKYAPNMELIESVGSILFRINVRHNSNVLKGPFMLDILESERKIVWECNNRSRFYVGSGKRTKTAYYDLQERVLKGMGYHVVQVPYWHWSRVTNRKARENYCKMSRYLAVKDIREQRQRLEYSPGQDPTKYGAKDAAFSNSSAFEYHGETFFTKEQPRRSWSWHGHSTVPIKVSL